MSVHLLDTIRPYVVEAAHQVCRAKSVLFSTANKVSQFILAHKSTVFKRVTNMIKTLEDWVVTGVLTFVLVAALKPVVGLSAAVWLTYITVLWFSPEIGDLTAVYKSTVGSFFRKTLKM